MSYQQEIKVQIPDHPQAPVQIPDGQRRPAEACGYGAIVELKPNPNPILDLPRLGWAEPEL